EEETTQALTRVHQLTLGGKSYPSYTYLAAPDDSIKGVNHDVKPGSTTDELLNFIRVGIGPQMITARMLGQSSSSLITFEGMIPSYVIYSASRQRVLPYRPLRHICARCLREGHRADLCPTPNNPYPAPRLHPEVLTVRWTTSNWRPDVPEALQRSPIKTRQQHQAYYELQEPNQAVAGKREQGKKPREEPDNTATRQNSSTPVESDSRAEARQGTAASRGTKVTPELRVSPPTQINRSLFFPTLIFPSFLPIRTRNRSRPENAQQTIARLQETRARLQEQLRAATEKEEIERNGQEGLKNGRSDHSIIEIEVAVTALKKFLKRHAMTDWDAFRKTRSGVTNEADDRERWVRDLQADAEKHTKHVNLTSQTPEMESRLLHLWEAKRSLLKRWNRQTLNHKLKLRIARLEKEALEHAEQLGKNNWHQRCYELQGTLGTAKTCSIQTDYPDYNGEPNTDLDAPLSEMEVIKAAQDLTRNTSPVFRDGTSIPVVKRVRILGLYLEQDGRSGYTISQLTNTTTQIIRMMSRITSRGHGLKEPGLIRITQALIISRIVYATPYLTLTARDKSKMDVITHKAYKIGLGLPPYTPNVRLLQLGVHNTYKELADAHRASQRERLALTQTGRRTYDDQKNVKCTDAATYSDRTATVASVIDHKMNTIVTASVKTTLPVVAEEMAIALAITSPTNQSRSRNATRAVTDLWKLSIELSIDVCKHGHVQHAREDSLGRPGIPRACSHEEEHGGRQMPCLQ
ncbi:hypothetical protein HPB47_011822, partial [Ixodes persulcatus]